MIDFESELERFLHVNNDEDSHTELEPNVFHPSQVASQCDRQCLRSKYGLEDHDTTTLGVFKLGEMIHELIENTPIGDRPGVVFEKPCETSFTRRVDGVDTVLKLTGRADCIDHHEGVVYDFKSRSGWYKFDPPKDRHLDQLTCYMAMNNCDEAQVVYISRKNLEIETWPKDGTFTFDPDRWQAIKDRVESMYDYLLSHGVDSDNPLTKEQLPERCDCWICEKEQEQN